MKEVGEGYSPYLSESDIKHKNVLHVFVFIHSFSSVIRIDGYCNWSVCSGWSDSKYRLFTVQFTLGPLYRYL